MTRRVCIIGHPVAHSRSPLLHGYWLKTFGIDGLYTREDITPDDFPGFLRELERAGYSGANITVPHKEAALSLIDEVDDTARAIGAVNTVCIRDGVIRGTNTDVYGFLANLDAGAPGWDGGRKVAVVLGAGGASRAVVFGLIGRGFNKIILSNRTLSRAQVLCADFTGKGLVAAAWSRLSEHLGAASLLVNATSLGMTGKPTLEIDLATLPPEAVVTDLVYAPLETELLREARQRGNRTVDGLGMLLHQAVPGFEQWFGRKPDVTPELRALLVADLTGGR